MQLFYDILVWVHIACWAAALVLWAMSLRAPRVPRGMAHAVATALVIGIVLTGIGSASEAVHDPNNVKVGLKLVIAAAATAIAFMKQKLPAPNNWGHVVAALVVVNVVIAYAWR